MVWGPSYRKVETVDMSSWTHELSDDGKEYAGGGSVTCKLGEQSHDSSTDKNEPRFRDAIECPELTPYPVGQPCRLQV